MPLRLLFSARVIIARRQSHTQCETLPTHERAIRVNPINPCSGEKLRGETNTDCGYNGFHQVVVLSSRLNKVIGNRE